MRPITIGIAGPKRAGKNTAASVIRQCLAEYDHELYVGQTHFADPMYEMLAAFVGQDTIDRLRDSDAKDTEIIEPFGCTLRHMAQTLGTEWGRNHIHNNAWVLTIDRRIQQAMGHELPGNADGVVVLIPDVRFPDEAEYVRNNGFLFHVDATPDQSTTHASENGIQPLDDETVIRNHDTLAEFEKKVSDYGRSTLRDNITATVRASAGNGRLLS